MSRSRLVLLLAFAGCYSPETPDCGLACEADTDCVADQVCTVDHWCAASGTTTCARRSVSDGGTVGSDAAMPDAGIASVTVTIQISGGGSVDASPGGTCDSGSCQFSVPISTAVTLTATGHGSNMFLVWTTLQCGGQASVCHFAPATSTTVGVKFGH